MKFFAQKARERERYALNGVKWSVGLCKQNKDECENRNPANLLVESLHVRYQLIFSGFLVCILCLAAGACERNLNLLILSRI